MSAALLVPLLFAAAAAPSRPPMRLGPPAVASPARVVTLAPSLTETVIALGGAERLVGVSRFDDAPQVRRLPRVGGYVDPSVEAVLALRPELVLVEPSPGNRAPVEQLARLGVPVLAVPLGNRDEVLAALRAVGSALGLLDRAEALCAEIERRTARVRASVRDRRPRALVVYDWEPLVVAGPGSFAEGLLLEAGALNAAAGLRGTYPVLGAEEAMRLAPEVIVDAAHGFDRTRQRLLRLPGLAGARVVVASPSAFHPGPRIAEAIEELFGALHPDVWSARP